MDKTFCPNGTFAVPRRPADAEKFTESFLCDEIHDNLRTLRLAMPFSDEFTQMFEKVGLSFRNHVSKSRFQTNKEEN